MIAQVIGIDDQITNTPTITASSAYVSGYQLGGLQTLAAFRQIYRSFDQPKQATDGSTPVGGKVILTSVLIIDKDKQNSAIDLLFFNQSPTIASSDHAAADISYAQLQAKCVGFVSVGTTYASLANASTSETANLNVLMKQYSGATTQNLFCLPVVRGTPTYTTTTSLTFIYNFFQD